MKHPNSVAIEVNPRTLTHVLVALERACKPCTRGQLQMHRPGLATAGVENIQAALDHLVRARKVVAAVEPDRYFAKRQVTVYSLVGPAKKGDR